MDNKNEMGACISKLRNKKGMSQKQLAENLGLTQQAVSLIEKGKRKIDLDVLKKIIDILDPDLNITKKLNAEISQGFLDTITLMHPYLSFEIEKELEYKELNHDNESRHHLLVYHYDTLGRVGRDSLIEILANLKILNEEGQKEASKRVQELTEIKKYMK